MRRVVVPIAILLVVAACGSADEDTGTSAPGGTTVESTTTTMADVTTTAAATSTSSTTTTSTTENGSGSDLASCVVGMWELDSDAFLAAVTEGLASESGELGEFAFGGGSYRLTVGADGSFVDERIDWTLLVVSDVGDLAVTINDRNVGTYTLEGDVLSTTIDTGEPPEVAFVIDGQPIEFPTGASPVDPPTAEFAGATVACAGDAMSAFFDGFTSEWSRIG